MKLAQRSWLPFVTLALLALAATATSIGHDFTYDDRGVIFDNPRVQSMLHVPQLFRETYWPAKYGGDKVMDATAFALARETSLPIIVFSIAEPGSIGAILSGTGRGTIVAG